MNFTIKYDMIYEFHIRMPSYVLWILPYDTELSFMDFTLEHPVVFYEIYPKIPNFSLE